MSLQPGSRLGGYEILGTLGAGGMGEVYRALDTRLRREVAIKSLPEAFADDAERLARFEREARLLAALNHPAIATVHDLEHDGTRRYIVMELVEGETLDARLGAEPIPVPEALRLARQIAEGLEAAHARGVVHCDLKPANIALTPDGRVKLLDFGLARAFAPERPPADASRSPTLTADIAPAGHIFGTVSYMSPEQARGREIDKRTDIWAFGCVLYEMLSGRKAFAGDSVPDTLARIFEDDPDWGALSPKTPPKVRELMRHCFQKDPNQRLRDIGDARIELDDTLSGQTHELPETPVRQNPGLRRAAIAAALLAAAVLAAYLVLNRRAEAPSEPGRGRHLAVLPFRNFTGSAAGNLWGQAMAETVSISLADVPGLQVVTPRAALETVDQDSNYARVAQRLGANTLLTGTLQRENERFRITYRLVDEKGTQLGAAAIDGSALFELQDLVVRSVVKDLSLRPGSRRTPTPSGLDTPAEQEKYLEAIGLLRRYDRPDRLARARDILEALAAENRNSALVQAALARAYLESFRSTKEAIWADHAVAATDSARTLDPGLPEVDVTLGETLLETGRAKAAAEAFRRALAARPGDVSALLGLARASEAVDDPAAAERAIRRALELEQSFAVFNQIAALYYDLGLYGDAAEMFRRAYAFAPDSARALSNLGGSETMRCNFPAALELYKKALEIDPKDASAISNLGMTQLWTGRSAEAVASLERASRERPNDYMILGNLGDAYRALGKTANSVAAYEKSISLARAQLERNPSDATALSFVATGLAKTGRAAEANGKMQQALSLDQKDPNALSDAAVVAALTGRDEDALAFLRRAADAGYCRKIIGRQPEFARLHENPEFRAIVAAPQKAAGS